MKIALLNPLQTRYSDYPVEYVDDGNLLDIIEQINGLSFTVKQDSDCRIFLVVKSPIHGIGHLKVTCMNVEPQPATYIPSFTPHCLVIKEISNYISEIVNRIYFECRFVFEDGYSFTVPKFKSACELKMKLSLIGEQ